MRSACRSSQQHGDEAAERGAEQHEALQIPARGAAPPCPGDRSAGHSSSRPWHRRSRRGRADRRRSPASRRRDAPPRLRSRAHCGSGRECRGSAGGSCRRHNRDSGASGRHSTTNSHRTIPTMRYAPLIQAQAKVPYRRMATLPQPASLSARNGHPGARRRLLRSGRGGGFSAGRSCASATTAGRRRSASASLSDDDWIRHFGRFEPLPDNLPEPLALRYHGHQFRVYNPDIGDGRGFLFAQLRDGEGPPARSRHQGLRPDALQPLRRRPADAQGRGARDPRDRNARGARRRHLARPSR